MKMDLNLLSISRSILLMAVLSKLALGLSVGSPFACGPVKCDRKGYDRCISQPLIGAKDRPCCLRCEEPDAKCGTIHEIGGCNLFCHEVILERELQKVTAPDNNTTPHHSEDGFHKTKKESILLKVALSVEGVLLAGMSVYTMTLKRQLRKHTRVNGNSDSSSSISSTDEESQRILPLEPLISQPSDGCKIPEPRPRPDFTSMRPTETENTEIIPS